MNPKSISNFLTMLLVLCGCVISIVLTVEHYQPHMDIGCRKVGGDCKATVDSAYGHIGPIPTSILGLGMYGVIGGLCIARMRKQKELITHTSIVDQTNAEVKGETSETVPAPVNSMLGAVKAISDTKRLDFAVWAIAILGTGISIWLQYVSLQLLKSFCPWCMGSALTIFLIMLLSSRDLWLDGKKLTGEQKLLAWVGAGISILMLFIYVPVLIEKIMRINYDNSEKPTYISVSSREILLEPKCHYIGSTDPDAYTLIEYADYQCGHCKKASEAVPSILKNAKQKLRFSFRNYPLEKHTFALYAARSAEAAALQGKYMEMHDLIYKNQEYMEKPGFSNDQFTTYARILKLDTAKFLKDINGKEVEDRIVGDKVAADVAGVQQTPTFFLVSPKPGVQALRLMGVDQLITTLANKDDAIWK